METENGLTGSFARTSVQDCYQCGKCTAGCPAAGRMDLMPNQILRLVQLGEFEKAMRCRAIWLCLSCLTCSARCPQSTDCAGVMDVLREEAAKQGVVPRDIKRVLLFQRAFLDNVRRYGRVNEVELIGQFKLQGFFNDINPRLLMQDSMLAPRLLLRRKFHLRGEKVRDREIVRRIFDRCMPPPGAAGKPAAEEEATDGAAAETPGAQATEGSGEGASQ